MTILQAIEIILNDYQTGLTSQSIYEMIIKRDLYKFGAKNPQGVVNGEIRRHCLGLDFPTAHPIKYFKVIKSEKRKVYYGLINSKNEYSLKNSTLVKENNTEMLPEEKILMAFNEHFNNIKSQLLDNILDKHPSFFEHLVVDLLLKMGYGYDNKSGIVTGGSHDGGVDGIINEDKLGLDLIYLQAKRYQKTNAVGRKELQAFVGVLQIKVK